MKYEVRVRVAASQGGHVERLEVDARDAADALVKACFVLQDDKGIDRWSLVGIAKVTS
jgi:hypothetical protein